MPFGHAKHEGGPQSVAQLRALLRSDLMRYTGRVSTRDFVVKILFEPGFKYTSWMRLCGYLRRNPLLLRTAYPPAKLVLLHYRYKYGIAIPDYTRVGKGFCITRFGGIFIHGDAVIGDNCNISSGTVLAVKNGGAHAGAPVLGDRVYLGHGAKVIGSVTIGDDVAIGTSSVVTKSVAAGCTVAGIPAKQVSDRGSQDYINRQA